MSDDKKYPPMPPMDDFEKTKPNIAVPNSDFGSNDWDKTNYNLPKQPPAGDWGKTVTNIKPIDTDAADFGKTQYNRGGRPATPDWGMTEANIDMADANFGGRSDSYDEGFGKTTPYFRLPETERAKYENLPPTPTEQAEQEKKEADAKGGIPGWFWISAGLMSMFFFAIIVLGIVYFVVLKDVGFEGTVNNAPIGSDIEVDGTRWSVISENNTYKLQNLRSGDRIVTIIHPGYVCEPGHIRGKDGERPEPMIARCKAKKIEAGDDCSKMKSGEFDKAERCFNTALEALPDPVPIDDLIKALNMLIINFESGKYNIPPVRMAALQKASEYIKKLPPSAVLEVGGHTDSDGSDAANQTLSENRANAVREALVKFGVSSSALTMKGYGESKPKAENTTDDGKFQNRRIEYSVVKR